MIASRYDCCGLLGVAEILGGTEISKKHSLISTSCCSLFKENPRLLKEFPKKLYYPKIFLETHFSLKDILKMHRGAFWRNTIYFHLCIRETFWFKVLWFIFWNKCMCCLWDRSYHKENKKSFLTWWNFPRMKQGGQEINIDVRLPFLTDLLCDTICQVVAGPGNSPGIGQHLSGLWPPQSKMENICQYVTFLNQRWSDTLVRTIRILCWGCQMSCNCGTKD